MGDENPYERDIAALRINQDPPVENCELRPFVLLRDRLGNQSADIEDEQVAFTWSRGQKRICSLQRCTGGAKIQCLQCLKLKRPPHLTFFCSGEHFRQAWPRHHAQLHSASAEPIEWSHDDGGEAISSDDPAKLGCRLPPPLANIWAPVSNEKRFTPRGEDVGRMLRLEATVKGYLDHSVKTVIETSSVLPEPEAPPPRQVLLNGDMPSSSSFKVFSYNILADMYATRQRYPYCPLWSLLWTYRRNNILRELLNSNADLIGLQEVQLDHFDDFLYPKLKEAGYEGIFKKKTRAGSADNPKQMDGCAIFYREDRFALMEQYSIEFNEAARLQLDQDSRGMRRSGQSNEHRNESLKRLLKGNVALMVVLEEIGYDPQRRQRRRKRRLCVANSHIFWDPNYNDVKMWQTMVLAQELEKLVMSRRLPLILIGDLNSTPDSAVYSFLQNGRLAPDDPVFKEDPYRVLPPPSSITHRLPLASAYAAILGSEPAYTNYTGDFVGCIDYIFFTTGQLRVVAVLKEDDENIVREYTALPSPKYPSDHIPLCVDFDWIG